VLPLRSSLFWAVEPAGPRRAGFGEAKGAQERDNGIEEPCQPEDGLALEKARDRDEKIHREADEDAESGAPSAPGARVRGRRAHEEYRAEERADDQGVDGGPPLLRPIHILHVKEEGELV
jgi:hypothetical protein